MRPFAQELDRRRISYWLDDAEIAWGDKITHRINEGLRRSDFVVVFLSPAFVGRNWTEAELASALNHENSEGRKVVLPVIIGDAATLLANYPLLRDKAYLNWAIGVPAIANELQRLKDRGWSLFELNQFIVNRVNLDQFPIRDNWGSEYRLLADRTQLGEGPIFFWDNEQQTVERFWYEGVICGGKQPLTTQDIEFVRAIISQNLRPGS